MTENEKKSSDPGNEYLNLFFTTLAVVFLGRVVAKPHVVTFVQGWIGSELAHVWIGLQILNLYRIRHTLVSNVPIGALAFSLNFWAFIQGGQATYQAFFARSRSIAALNKVGVPPILTSSHNDLLSTVASLVPLFYLSRRGVPMTIERHIPYASLEQIDKPLYDAWNQRSWLSQTIWMPLKGRVDHWLSLDVYHRADVRLQDAPVVVVYHGGAYQVGDKLYALYALTNRLASRGIIVFNCNYRMCQERTWPVHIIDCKRALIWVKRNCHRWGGNPNKVFVTGDSAGGHLAALVGVTPNFPPFQPDDEFREEDTSIRGCLPLYGVSDVTNSASRKNPQIVEFFSKIVIRKRFEDARHRYIFDYASPLYHVRQAMDKPITIPPFFTSFGTLDILCSIDDCKVLMEELRQFRIKHNQNVNTDVFVELNNAHHAYGTLPSLLSDAVSDAMADFIFYWSSE